MESRKLSNLPTNKMEVKMDTKKNYEESIKELEKVVARLESGELPLDESVEEFQKGIELSRYCSKKLDEIEKKISILLENENGDLIEKPFLKED